MNLKLLLAVMLATQAANPLSNEVREAYQKVRGYILASAEKMPEENYTFRPAPRVRTFGEIVGHVAQEQYLFFCGPVKGEHKAADIEKTLHTKRELVAALQDSFAYCDAVYDHMTDAEAVEKVEGGGTKLRLLWQNVLHDGEHYGNIVTYMRIKGLVPPSTEGQ